MKWSALIALMAIEAVLLCAGISLASRNSAGTMGSVNGPYSTLTTISSTAVNARLADIESELTNSLDRSGRGGMLAALRGIDGTVAAPALSFTSETGTGGYRIGAGDVGWSILGTKKLELTASAFTVTPNLGVGISPLWPFQVQASIDQTVAVIGGGSRSPITLFSSANQSQINSNATNDGTTGWKYVTSTGALALSMETGGNGFIFQTAPSGTAGNAVTFTERARITTAGLTIGTSGTAISGSFRGTTSWTPGTVNAQTCTTTTFAVTGAAVGAECMTGTPAAGVGNVPIACWIPSTNNCTVQLCNPTAANQSAQAGTYSCRAFNP